MHAFSHFQDTLPRNPWRADTTCGTEDRAAKPGLGELKNLQSLSRELQHRHAGNAVRGTTSQEILGL